MNIERETGKDEAIRSNLETIQTQTRIMTTPFDTFNAADCRSGIFTEPTIAAALEAIMTENNHSTLICHATTRAFVVVAARPNLGFFNPSSGYWCGDTVHAVCSVDSLVVDDSHTCPCKTSP